MNNIKVTKIEFLGDLCSTSDVCADDLTYEVNKNILELKKECSIIPVKITIQVNITGKNIADDVADEVMAVARRTLKSVEYVNEADRGAINSGRLTGDKPYMFAVKANPLSVIEALTSGYPYNVKIIGFLTREK